MSGAIRPEAILRELAGMWATLAAPEPGGSTSPGVLRACSMTLIVAAADERDAMAIGETLAGLMHEHPSRVIVLKPAPAGETPSARVSAQCWMPFGGRQQICCEQVEIVTPEGQLDEVARVLVGLLAPDLPAVLWTRHAPWLERAGFERLEPLIGKIVLDSRDVEGSSSELAMLRRLRAQSRPRVADLAWARLTLWREMVANTLAGVELASIREIETGYFGAAPSTSCYYLAAWLSRAMPRARVSFLGVAGDFGRIASLRLRGDNFELTFERSSGETVRIAGARSGVVVLPHSNDYLAMREELSITGADPVFDATWARAEQLRASIGEHDAH
jgi:glucose-6-phosphate dehydrogenase assembly protein OpcA